MVIDGASPAAKSEFKRFRKWGIIGQAVMTNPPMRLISPRERRICRLGFTICIVRSTFIRVGGEARSPRAGAPRRLTFVGKQNNRRGRRSPSFTLSPSASLTSGPSYTSFNPPSANV